MGINKVSCICLKEIENNLPRTKHCFIPCKAQYIILKNRQNNLDK